MKAWENWPTEFLILSPKTDDDEDDDEHKTTVATRTTKKMETMKTILKTFEKYIKSKNKRKNGRNLNANYIIYIYIQIKQKSQSLPSLLTHCRGTWLNSSIGFGFDAKAIHHEVLLWLLVQANHTEPS